jgi:hypothetical protein
MVGLSAGGTPITINSSTPVLSSSGEPAIRRAGGIVEELLISMQSVPPPNLGLLLIGFLQSFGREIDFSHVRLVLKVLHIAVHCASVEMGGPIFSCI